MEGVACRNPQTEYSRTQKSLQQEWAFMHHISPEVGHALCLVEDSQWENFFPELFQWLEEDMPDWEVTQIWAKYVGLALLDLTLSSPDNWTASWVVTGHLSDDLQRWKYFLFGDHAQMKKDICAEIRRHNSTKGIREMNEMMVHILPPKVHCTRRRRKTDDWIYFHQSTSNGMEIGVQEWRDALLLHYGVYLQEPPYCCDGCRDKFFISEVIDLKNMSSSQLSTMITMTVLITPATASQLPLTYGQVSWIKFVTMHVFTLIYANP